MMITSGDDKPFAPLKPATESSLPSSAAVPSTSSKIMTGSASSGSTNLLKSAKNNGKKEGNLDECLNEFEAFLSDLEADVKSKSSKKEKKRSSSRSRSRSRHRSSRRSPSREYDNRKYYK